MNAWRVFTVEIAGSPSQTERGWNADARCAGGEPNKWCRRCRMPIEWSRVKCPEQWCCRRWIAAKPKEIFEPQLEFLVARQQIRRGDSRHFVAERPHGVKPK